MRVNKPIWNQPEPSQPSPDAETRGCVTFSQERLLRQNLIGRVHTRWPINWRLLKKTYHGTQGTASIRADFAASGFSLCDYNETLKLSGFHRRTI